MKKNQPQVYQEWLRMVMKQKNWWVIVTTDRGLYAPWFYQAIQQLQPLLAIAKSGAFAIAILTISSNCFSNLELE